MSLNTFMCLNTFFLFEQQAQAVGCLDTEDKQFIFKAHCHVLQEQQDSPSKLPFSEFASFVQQRSPGAASLFSRNEEFVI